MSSAAAGVRMVARALPGSGGSAARARASAACLAACRAAHGAAPRRPKRRLASFGSAAGCAACAGAPFLLGFAVLFGAALDGPLPFFFCLFAITPERSAALPDREP